MMIVSCLLFCYVPNFTSHKTFLVNELLVLSDDCRYLVLLAKIQNKVDKNEETLLSLQRVSDFQFCNPFSQDYFQTKITAVPK